MAALPPLILIVDDDEANREVLSHRLLQSGYEVETASSGPEAIASVASGTYDLMLLDTHVPGRSWLDVLRALRAQQTPGNLPIIMVTGRSESDDIVAALDLGADDYVVTPVDIPVAIARIRTQLARRQAERALGESEGRYALAVRGANDGIWDWKLDRGEGYFSPRWRTVVGYAESDELTSLDAWFARVHPDDLARLKSSFNDHLDGRTAHFECEHRIHGPRGSCLWVLARGIAVRSPEGRATRIAGSLTDITEGKVVDALTGLPNRVLFIDHLGRLMEHAERHPEFQVAVMFLEIHRFEVVNDSLGHHAGNALLVQAARRLEGCLLRNDTVSRVGDSASHDAEVPGSAIARVGGDEFGVLLGGIDQASIALGVAERIHAAFLSPFKIADDELFASLSIGVAMSGAPDLDPADLLRGADTAMHRAKGLGPSHTEVFSPGMRKDARVRLQTDTDLRRALDRDEFELQYQAIVALESERVETLEALIRWRHPIRGVLGPHEFIAAAEESGLIVPVGYWVLRQACADLRRWHAIDPKLADIRVAVNLSPRQLAIPDLAARLGTIVEEAGVQPDKVEFEITESSVMTDPDLAGRTLEQLKSRGFRLSIDDFGTGHSSLSYVHRFPIDRIKVDRSFLLRGRTEKETEVVIRAIVDIGQQLGLDVIAEGIETTTELAKLKAINCKWGQGYLFSAPETSASVSERLARSTVRHPISSARSQRVVGLTAKPSART